MLKEDVCFHCVRFDSVKWCHCVVTYVHYSSTTSTAIGPLAAVEYVVNYIPRTQLSWHDQLPPLRRHLPVPRTTLPQDAVPNKV